MHALLPVSVVPSNAGVKAAATRLLTKTGSAMLLGKRLDWQADANAKIPSARITIAVASRF